jgi:hypothetical protein
MELPKNIMEQFGVKEDPFKPYEYFDDVRLPWGCIGGGFSTMEVMIDGIYLPRTTLDSINRMRKESTETRKGELLALKSMEKNSVVRQFLIDNIDKVRTLPHRSGTNNVVMYFAYDNSTLTFKFFFYKDRFITTGNVQHHRVYSRMSKEVDLNDKDNKDYNLNIFKYMVENGLFDELEFIPFVILEANLCPSHKAYVKYVKGNELPVKAFNNPVYGINIKNSEDVMCRLTDWFERGGSIKDYTQYLILVCKDDSSKYYLRNYRKATEGETE